MSARPQPPAPSPSLVARMQLAEDMIGRGEPLADTLALLCHVVEAEARTLVRAAILLVDHDAQCLRTGAAPGLPDRYNDAVDGIGISPTVGTCARAAAIGKSVVTPDIAADPGWDGISHLPIGLGLVAAWSQPIFGRDGRVLGTLGTYFSERRGPTDHERNLVTILAHTAAAAIEASAVERAD